MNDKIQNKNQEHTEINPQTKKNREKDKQIKNQTMQSIHSTDTTHVT